MSDFNDEVVRRLRHLDHTLEAVLGILQGEVHNEFMLQRKKLDEIAASQADTIQDLVESNWELENTIEALKTQAVKDDKAPPTKMVDGWPVHPGIPELTASEKRILKEEAKQTRMTFCPGCERWFEKVKPWIKCTCDLV